MPQRGRIGVPLEISVQRTAIKKQYWVSFFIRREFVNVEQRLAQVFDVDQQELYMTVNVVNTFFSKNIGGHRFYWVDKTSPLNVTNVIDLLLHWSSVSGILSRLNTFILTRKHSVQSFGMHQHV